MFENAKIKNPKMAPAEIKNQEAKWKQRNTGLRRIASNGGANEPQALR